MPTDRAVVVTHGGFANYLLHEILGTARTPPHWFEIANCAITSIRFVPEEQRENWPLYPAAEAEILGVNDVSHLSDAI